MWSEVMEAWEPDRDDSAVFTNADRIRAMNDEELAEYGVYGFSIDGVTIWRGHFDGFADTEAEAIHRELDWLQQPAPEEGKQL